MRKQFNSKLQQFVSTLLTLILVLGFNYGLFAQKNSNELYAYTPDGKIEFKLSAQKLLIKFKGQLNFRDKKSVLSSYTSLKPLESSMLLPSPEVCVAEFAANTSSDREIWNCIAALNANKNIEYANPMLIYADGTMQAAMNRLFVKLHRAGDLTLLQEDASQLHFKLTEAYAYDPLIRFIEVDKSCDKNALQLANYLAETKKYAAAETDFLKFLHRFSTNDPNLLNQWSLNNTGSALQFNGTPGCDMSVFNAWTLTTGNASTKVAVIDEGVDLNHPDLINNLLPGFDATQQNSGGAPQGNDAHGTACAGIIAAQGNNNLGIAGVAYNCKIVPVRIAYGNGSNWVTSDAWIGTGIDWAWNQGDADVLSNSWGGGSSSTLINDPIGRAVTQGRGGLGSPVLFSAGNSNLNAAAYPSSLSNTISVIAMSMCNQRKSPNSCDGETWWGSNYGTGADVAAPGVKIFTCDISGAAGYVSGDFLDYFNGTSSACPNAAGVMALLLSANPALTYTQARQIFEASCDKVGSYGYNANVANQPNGTWSTELGYGRVNAYAALQMANPSACAGAPSNINTIASGNNFCTPTTVTFALQNMPFNSGFIYQWQSSFDNITYNDIAGETQAVYVANLVNASAYYRCKIKCFDSTYSNPIQVVFIDPSISVFPHTEKFTSSGLPCGWTVQNVNADASTWISMSTSYRTASYSMGYAKNTTLAADDWLFSPALNLTAGTEYKVRFWYKGRSAALPEKLEIKWGAANNAAAMTSPAIFSNTNITHTVYTLANSSGFIPATSGQYYIGFHVMSNANMYDLNIDDITFDVVQPCTTPLQGGTITGPSTIEAGNAQLSAYTLSAYTGLDIQWQYSSNNGTTWVDYGGAIYSTANIFFPTVGTYLLRARVSGSNCPDAFSSVKTITVIPRIGDAIGNPILVSNLPYSIGYLQTGAASGFTSTYTGPNAQPSNDIFWKFTTGPCADSIIVGTCGSTFDNYVHVLDANGTWIYSMDDGPICGQQAVFTIPVQPNTTYYLVVEGYGTASGLLGLGIEERYNPNNVPSISASGSTAICPGDNLTLTASSGTAYLWSNGATTQSITVNATGTYSVSVTNSAACVKTTSIIISSGVGR